LSIAMKRTPSFLRSGLLWVMLLLLLAGCAGQPGQIPAIEVSVQEPTAVLEQGRSFNVHVQLRNTSQEAAQLSEIRLPANLLSAFIYEGSLPAIPLIKAADGSGMLRAEMTLAPGSSQDFVFRFMALDPGDYVETGFALVDGVKFPFSLQARVRGTNPAGWKPGISTRFQTMVNADTPDQALVQIKALVEINGKEQIGWQATGALISSDGLILTSARAVLGNRFYPVKDIIVALTVTPEMPPVEKYRASIVQVDEALDVAMVKLRTDLSGTSLDFSSLQLPALPVASSVSAYLPGEPLAMWGFPMNEGEPLIRIDGLVVGVLSEAQAGDQERILTSFEAEGDYFGWIATNSIGEIIGIARPPTEHANLTCHALRDSNRDGSVDEQDTCVPAGGSLSELLPADAFTDLLTSAYQGKVGFRRSQASSTPYNHAGEIIYQDDFSPSTSRWHSSWEDPGSMQIKDGQLVLQVSSSYTLSWATVDYAYEAMSISTTAQVLAGSGDGDFGFVCGVTDGQRFTVLEVSEDGYFSIWKRNGNQTHTLVDWTYAEVIAAGGALQLSAECSSESLKLAVNNGMLAEVVDPQFTPGAVGFIVGTFSGSNLSVSFDDVEIRIP
jgi:hypothetical protein